MSSALVLSGPKTREIVLNLFMALIRISGSSLFISSVSKFIGFSALRGEREKENQKGKQQIFFNKKYEVKFKRKEKIANKKKERKVCVPML